MHFQLRILLREGMSKDEGNTAKASPNISWRLEYHSANFSLHFKFENWKRARI